MGATAYTELMNLQDPYMMKERAKQIKGYSKSAWLAKCEEVAYIATKEKYDRNPLYADVLLSTYPKLLGEASTEQPWGCGLTLRHSDIGNPRL